MFHCIQLLDHIDYATKDFQIPMDCSEGEYSLVAVVEYLYYDISNREFGLFVIPNRTSMAFVQSEQ